MNDANEQRVAGQPACGSTPPLMQLQGCIDFKWRIAAAPETRGVIRKIEVIEGVEAYEVPISERKRVARRSKVEGDDASRKEPNHRDEQGAKPKGLLPSELLSFLELP